MNNKNFSSLAFVLACTGKYQDVEGLIESTLQSLEIAANILHAEIIIGFDDRVWQNIPMVQTIENRFPTGALKTFYTDQPNNMAGVYNRGVNLTEAKYVSFIYPGCLPIIEKFKEIQPRLEREQFDWLARVDDKYTKALGVSPQQLCETLLGYFLSIDTLFPLCQAVVKREKFIALGGFSESPILQRDFDSEFWLRSVYQGDKISLDAIDLCQYTWSLKTFPLRRDFNLPAYLANSYKLRRSHTKDEYTAVQKFIFDLDGESFDLVHRLYDDNPESVLFLEKRTQTKPYKIAITGGVWEYVHNKLCFYNPLRVLEGAGEFIYFPMFDFDADFLHNLLGVDCVIISRGRHENVLKILEFCKNYQIPVIYMIDDNWFSVGKDYPSPYASIFSPGLPAYEVFLTCIRESDAVLVYNPLLEEDVKKYAKRVIRLEVNISLNDFKPPVDTPSLFDEKITEIIKWRKETNGLIIGYAGSARYNDNAFKALVHIKRGFPKKVRLLLFGVLTPEQKKLFDDSEAIIPYVSYETYGTIIAQLKPDILIAPLEPSRTSQSKCPNKYLEYSAIGAVGVYSNLHPYSDVVSNDNTGVLIDDNTVESWESAIVELINNTYKRNAIAKNASEVVRKKYETGIIAPSFASAVRSVISGRNTKS
jgi:glycosyltransferase involved in cell wall biosynthesis